LLKSLIKTVKSQFWSCSSICVNNFENAYVNISGYYRLSHMKSISNCISCLPWGACVQWRTQEFFRGGGGGSNSVQDRENGYLGAVPPLVRGSGGSCNLVQEISYAALLFLYIFIVSMSLFIQVSLVP
jgi:hypothetical protein